MPETATTLEEDISLRDIYIIIKTYAWLLLLVPLLLGALGFVVFQLLPKQYKAESVALVSPTPIQLEGNNALGYKPSSDVSFEAYKTLAESRVVLEQAVSSVADMRYTELSGKVTELVGPQRPDQVVSLLITHEVTHIDPEIAASLANAWANATLETVQKTLLTNLDPLVEQTNLAAQALLSDVNEAELDLETFEAQDATDRLRVQLSQIAELLANANNDLVAISELASVSNVSGAIQAANTVSSSARLNLSQEIAANDAIIKSLKSQTLSADLQDELVFRQALAQSLAARQTTLNEQKQTYETTYLAIQNQLSALKRERKMLERELNNALLAYEGVVSLQPRFDYLTRLAPANAQLLNKASVPTLSSSPRVLLSTAVVVLLSFFFLLLFVFLKEAVRPSEKS